MKNNIDSNFAIAILALVAACVGFAFWLSTDSFGEEMTQHQIVNVRQEKSRTTLNKNSLMLKDTNPPSATHPTVGVQDVNQPTDQSDTPTTGEVDITTYANKQVVVEHSADSLESKSHGARYSAPGQITSLCDRLGEVQLRDADGGFHSFRTPAGDMRSYNNDELWIASESGPDAAIFYFDNSGLVIDICQPLFSPEACGKYEEFSPYDAFDICGE